MSNNQVLFLLFLVERVCSDVFPEVLPDDLGAIPEVPVGFIAPELVGGDNTLQEEGLVIQGLPGIVRFEVHNEVLLLFEVR